MAVGGFDSRFRTAGDDVDLCWRFLERGWKIGFHAGAMVWHHRRRSVAAFWKQQVSYGYAEGVLEMKWPAKYNSFGNIRWQGSLYGRGIKQAPGPEQIYQGVWGTAPFQRIYSSGTGTTASLLFGRRGISQSWPCAGLSLSTSGTIQWLMALLFVSFALIPVISIAKSVAATPFLNDKLRYRVLTGCCTSFSRSRG